MELRGASELSVSAFHVPANQAARLVGEFRTGRTGRQRSVPGVSARFDCHGEIGGIPSNLNPLWNSRRVPAAVVCDSPSKELLPAAQGDEHKALQIKHPGRNPLQVSADSKETQWEKPDAARCTGKTMVCFYILKSSTPNIPRNSPYRSSSDLSLRDGDSPPSPAPILTEATPDAIDGKEDRSG